jgi:hypothetical protein
VPRKVSVPWSYLRQNICRCRKWEGGALCHLTKWISIAKPLQSWCSQLTKHARNIPSAVCVAPPEDEQVMLETCRGPYFLINWIKSASRWFHYTCTDILWCMVNKTLNLTKWSLFQWLYTYDLFALGCDRWLVCEQARRFPGVPPVNGKVQARLPANPSTSCSIDLYDAAFYLPPLSF